MGENTNVREQVFFVLSEHEAVGFEIARLQKNSDGWWHRRYKKVSKASVGKKNEYLSKSVIH